MVNKILKKQYALIIILIFPLYCSCQNIKKTKSNPIPIKAKTVSKTSDDTLNWYTELCEMNSKYDKSKYTKKQLKDTYKLWFNTSVYINFKGFPVFKLDEKTEPIEVLEENYAENKAAIENLEIVNLPYWNNIKKIKLEQLKSFYEYEKTAFFAYSNLSLLSNSKYDLKAKVYVDALVSGDSLKMIAAWKKLNEEQKAANGSPEYVEKKFQSRLKSPQCMEYAKMDLFSFGWSNNAIKTTVDYTVLENTDKMLNEFKKLFIATKENCSEP